MQRRSSHNPSAANRGLSLVELMVVVSAASMLLLAGARVAIPWIGESRTSTAAAVDIETFLGLARAEAVSRDRVCRFVLDPKQRTVAVYDTLGTANLEDDLELYRHQWTEPVPFGRPDVGRAISLPLLGQNGLYQVLFTPRSGVPTGSAEVSVGAGSDYRRIRLQSTGDIAVDRWLDGAWSPLG